MSDDDEIAEDDPLEDIFVDGEAIDRTVVGDILRPYLQIDEDTGELYPMDGYHDLNSKEQILVTLAAQRAKEIRGALFGSRLLVG